MGVNVCYDVGPDQFPMAKGLAISRLITELGHQYDCYLPIDCDEFISLDASNGPAIDADAIRSEIQSALSRTETPLFRLNGCYANIPGTTLLRREHHKKVMVRSLPPGMTLDYGFHLYDYYSKTDSVSPDLISPTTLLPIHCHYKPYRLQVRYARQKLQSRVHDFSPEALRTYGGGGRHLTKYLLMTEEEYEAYCSRVEPIRPSPELEALLAAVNAGWAQASRAAANDDKAARS